MNSVPGDASGPGPIGEQEVLRGLERKVAAEILLRGDRAARWATRGGIPEAVAVPRSVAEAADVMGWASELGLSVAVSGGGSQLAGRAGEGRVDLVVTAAAISEMGHYEPADLTFSAGAGVTGSMVAKAAGMNGQMLPLDPPGWKAATLGGLFSRGRAGGLQTAYGRVRDLALGLTLVTGDGKVLRVGGQVVKNVAGFDLVRLAVGSHGSLGLIAEVSARLFPVPERDAGVWVGLRSDDQLLACARVVREAPFPLAGAEARDDWRFEDRGRGMVLRVQGNVEPAEEMCSFLLESLREHSPERMARGTLAQAVDEVGRLDSSATRSDGILLRFSGLPADLGVTLGLAREVMAAVHAPGVAAGPTPPISAETVELICSPLTGEVRLGSGCASLSGIAALAEAASSASERLELRGGSLEILGDRVGLSSVWEPTTVSSAVHTLGRSLCRVFDSGGALGGGARGANDEPIAELGA